MRDNRPDGYVPKMGDIGLTQIHGRVGSLIRFGQWLNGDGFEDYQHAYVVVSDSEVVEAMPEGARLWPLSHYESDRRYTTKYLRCPDEFRMGVATAARELIGTPYSFLDYLSLFLRRLHIPAPRLRKYIADSGHMICSQLADEAALRGGWYLFNDRRWPGDVIPLDLHHLYSQQEFDRQQNL